MNAMPAEKLDEFYEEEQGEEPKESHEDNVVVFPKIEPPFEPEELAPKQDWRLDLETIIEKAKEWRKEGHLSYSDRHELGVDVTRITKGELNYFKFLEEKEKDQLRTRTFSGTSLESVTPVSIEGSWTGEEADQYIIFRFLSAMYDIQTSNNLQDHIRGFDQKDDEGLSVKVGQSLITRTQHQPFYVGCTWDKMYLFTHREEKKEWLLTERETRSGFDNLKRLRGFGGITIDLPEEYK